ncbi:unnamed protein product [Closterium sp. NIES-54]
MDGQERRHLHAPHEGLHGAVPPPYLNHREVHELRALRHPPWDQFRYRANEQSGANQVYANDGRSYATLEDEAAAAILDQDNTSKFPEIDRHNDDDDDDKSPPGAAGGSSRDPVPPSPPEPKSDDDGVQEVIRQHCLDTTVS